MLENLGRDEEAVESYRKAIEIEPESVWYWTRLGPALERLDRIEEAAQAYRKATALEPKPRMALGAARGSTTDAKPYGGSRVGVPNSD